VRSAHPAGQAAGRRRIVGLALLAGAAMMIVAAVLAYTGLLPVPAGQRGLLAGVLGAVAGMDLLIGLRFLLASRS
jgi:hypothetical protein